MAYDTRPMMMNCDRDDDALTPRTNVFGVIGGNAMIWYIYIDLDVFNSRNGHGDTAADGIDDNRKRMRSINQIKRHVGIYCNTYIIYLPFIRRVRQIL